MSKEKLIYLPVGILTAATMLSGALLLSAGGHAASDTATASVTIGDACSFTDGEDYEGAFTANSGGTATTDRDEAKKSVTATCNDPEGFSIYAIGASVSVMVDDVAHTNYMVGTGGVNIPTGTDGDSYWAMKITSASSGTPQNGFSIGSYAAVPNSNTEILRVSGSTEGAASTTMRTDYVVKLSDNQPAGTYTGKVKYTLVHPSGAQPTN